MLLPKQAVTYSELRASGLSRREILSMSSALKLFPTPYKGIYYAPLEEERKGAFIEQPMMALTQSTALFLRGKGFYYSCRTAEEALGLNWRPSGEMHIVNPRLSRRILLNARISRNRSRKTWRAKKIAKLLSFYGSEIIFHKARDFASAKARQTPYGRFALKSQIRVDKKRFREDS